MEAWLFEPNKFRNLENYFLQLNFYNQVMRRIENETCYQEHQQDNTFASLTPSLMLFLLSTQINLYNLNFI